MNRIIIFVLVAFVAVVAVLYANQWRIALTSGLVSENTRQAAIANVQSAAPAPVDPTVQHELMQRTLVGAS